MKKLLFILLITIPFIGFGQNDTLRYYHEKGQLKDIGIFKNGKEHGKFISWWKNGNVKKMEYYYVIIIEL